MALFAALKHRPFALLWGGQTISQLGDSLYNIAMTWYVLEKTGSASATGTMLTLSFAPRFLFLLIGGLAADRVPRAVVMLTSDILRALLVGSLALLAHLQRLEMWHVYGASALFGLTSAFFEPAFTTLIPDVTPKDTLSSANALNTLGGLLSGVSGPGLGALVVGGLGTPAVFAFNALSFFLSGLCLLPLLALSMPGPVREPSGGLLVDLRRGFGFVSSMRWLWITLTLLALVNLTGRSPMSVALPFLVNDNFDADVRALGFLHSTFSLGSVVGTVGIGRVRALRRRGQIIFGGLVVVGMLTLALGLPMPLPLAATAMFLMAGSLAVVNLVWSVILQACVPAGMQGRVVSLSLLASNGLLPVGFGLAGWATDTLGPAAVFAIGGGLTVVFALLGLMQSDIRALGA